MRPTLLSCLLLVAASVTGCAVIPEYTPKAGQATASLNTQGLGHKWACIDGRRHRLAPNESKYAEIPAGKRLTIGVSFVNYSGGSFSISCNPRSSFVPQTGERYFVDFDIEGERCYAIVFKEDPGKRTGLALDPSFGPPTDCFGQ